MNIPATDIGKQLDIKNAVVGTKYIFKSYPITFNQSAQPTVRVGQLVSKTGEEENKYYIEYSTNDGAIYWGEAYSPASLDDTVAIYEYVATRKAQENALVKVAASGALPAHLVKHIGKKYLSLKGGKRRRKRRTVRRR